MKWCRCFAALCAAGLMVVGRTAAAEAGQPAFASLPKAVTDGAGVRLQFELAAPDDVALDIVGTDGTVLRHLGAAALGRNATPPPFQPGLAQSLVWDRKDDAGQDVSGGAYAFRVQVGLQPRFDRYIGWDENPPFAQCAILGFAVAKDGSFCTILGNVIPGMTGHSETRLCAFSKDGEYQGTIYPFPATADPKNYPGVSFFSEAPNRLAPRVYDRGCVSLLPHLRAVTRQTMAMAPDGRLVFVSGWMTETYRVGPRSILIMNRDGTIPRARFEGPALVAEPVTAGFTHLGLSPDGKTAYVCGLQVGEYPRKLGNVVLQTGLEINSQPSVLFGRTGESLSGKDGLTDPRGLIVGPDGRIYISDYGNNRIAVLEANGTFVTEIPITRPEALTIDPATGAIYVVSMQGIRNYKLVKLSGLPAPNVVAELDLSAYGGVSDPDKALQYSPLLAMQFSQPRPVLLLASPSQYTRYTGLLRIEDQGATLAAEKFKTWDKSKATFAYPQAVDADDNLYYFQASGTGDHDFLLRGGIFEGKTGRILPWVGKTGDLFAAGRNGQLFRRTGAVSLIEGGFSKINRENQVIPWLKTGELSDKYHDDWGFRKDNLDTGPNGEVWMLHYLTRGGKASIAVFNPDGTLKQDDVVSGLLGPNSCRVDSRGNIFVAEGLHPANEELPPEIQTFAKRVREKTPEPRALHGEAIEDSYGEGYGVILKFGPAGGKLRETVKAEAGETLFTAYPGKRSYAASEVQSAYHRISPMSAPRLHYTSCWCLVAFFDLDRYDRLFVPDGLQFCVRVLDANFNEITRFGAYDAASGKGGAANAPGPEIPFEFPAHVNVSDAAAYVMDGGQCAQRVVRVKLAYRDQASCAIPK